MEGSLHKTRAKKETNFVSSTWHKAITMNDWRVFSNTNISMACEWWDLDAPKYYS
jgi:hypothetical protein